MQTFSLADFSSVRQAYAAWQRLARLGGLLKWQGANRAEKNKQSAAFHRFGAGLAAEVQARIEVTGWQADATRHPLLVDVSVTELDTELSGWHSKGNHSSLQRMAEHYRKKHVAPREAKRKAPQQSQC